MLCEELISQFSIAIFPSPASGGGLRRLHRVEMFHRAGFAEGQGKFAEAEVVGVLEEGHMLADLVPFDQQQEAVGVFHAAAELDRAAAFGGFQQRQAAFAHGGGEGIGHAVLDLQFDPFDNHFSLSIG